jgi:hypothetical protein
LHSAATMDSPRPFSLSGSDGGYGALRSSAENVEEQTGINEGTLYRLETARARPQRRTLMALLDL